MGQAKDQQTAGTGDFVRQRQFGLASCMLTLLRLLGFLYLLSSLLLHGFPALTRRAVARPKGICVLLTLYGHTHVTNRTEDDVEAIRFSSNFAAVIIRPPMLAAEDLVAILALRWNVVLLIAGVNGAVLTNVCKFHNQKFNC